MRSPVPRSRQQSLLPLLLDSYSRRNAETSKDLLSCLPGLTPAKSGLWWCLRRLYASLPPHTELQMPALSPTMSAGNIASWRVKPGDELEAGTILAEIETDKATLEWENQDDGFLAKILQEAGAKDVAVGTPLAILVEEAEQVAAFADYKSEGGSQKEAAAPSSSEPEAQPEASTSGQQTPVNERIGPAATVLLHEHGLSPGDITPTGRNGIVTKGDVLKAIAGGAQPKQKKAAEAARPRVPPSQASDKPPEPPTPADGKPPSKSLDHLKGKQDKKPEPAHQPASRPSKKQPYEDIPNSQIRKIIAQRLLESKQTVPHLYVQADADVDKLTELRATLKEQGIKVSVNDFIVQAVAQALEQVPSANAFWDAKAEQIQPGKGVDVAVAVATDKGLITPIVKDANTKSLQQISKEVRELAGRARANKLKPDEFQGGSFSISNLGMFGIDYFSAIINPPQACIMAVGGTRKRVLLHSGSPEVKSYITVTLSADHRVYDGATAHAFLAAFQANIQNPVKLLL